MTTYLVFWAFPYQEASVKFTPAFVQYLIEGKKGKSLRDLKLYIDS